MKLIRGLHNLPKHWSCAVVTIGNFDGIHKGHQVLINRCIELAKQRQAASVLMTFEPYPHAYLSQNDQFSRLMSLRDKYLMLQTLGIDYLLVLPFNKALAQLSAADFVSTILVKSLKINAVVVGDDFRFGAKRGGDFTYLQSLASRYHYEAVQVLTQSYDHKRISSSRLRDALARGDLELAEILLGRPYCLSGQVVTGDHRGRRWGFPTANIHVSQKKLPLSGIFAVKVAGLSKAKLFGVASVGHRPMYPTQRDLLEVFLLDFDKDVYKQHATVTFLKRLRGEICFSSTDELIMQIKQDVEQSRHFFGLL